MEVSRDMLWLKISMAVSSMMAMPVKPRLYSIRKNSAPKTSARPTSSVCAPSRAWAGSAWPPCQADRKARMARRPLKWVSA